MAASRPLDAALATYSLYLSLSSMSTLRILIYFFGCTVCSLMVNESVVVLYDFLVKWIMAIFSASNVAPLLFSQSIVSLIIVSMPSRLPYAVGPVTHAVKSSTKAIAPP